jgi:RNA polymerase subunit RPABC4/transcription elongation factor Spt4
MEEKVTCKRCIAVQHNTCPHHVIESSEANCGLLIPLVDDKSKVREAASPRGEENVLRFEIAMDQA